MNSSLDLIINSMVCWWKTSFKIFQTYFSKNIIPKYFKYTLVSKSSDIKFDLTEKLSDGNF